MSEMVDDELLGGEEDELDDNYDISNEREEALLQEDDDYTKEGGLYDDDDDDDDDRKKGPYSDDDSAKDHLYDDRKKNSYSDIDEPEDVLNLDIEEDFHDEGDDDLEREEQKHPPQEPQSCKQTSQIMSKMPTKKTTEIPNRSIIKTAITVPQDANTVKRGLPTTRKRGVGRGNFQMRQQNFAKKKMQRRRNGTVLINPRYEGTVHINENNARLAWDKSQYGLNSQNNMSFVQPWMGQNILGTDANQLLVKKLVSGLTSNFPQSPLLQQPCNNFYEPPAPNNYEQPLCFEPPPNITPDISGPPYNSNQQYYSEWNNSYNQMTERQLMPPSDQMQSRHPHFNNQITTNRAQGDMTSINSYSNYNYQSKKNLTQVLVNTYDYNRGNRNPNYNTNYSSPNNCPNNMNYTNSSYQNRIQNYSNNGRKPENNNFNTTNFQNNNLNGGLGSMTNWTDVKQTQNANTFHRKFHNRSPQQGNISKGSNSIQRNNRFPPNNNLTQEGCRRRVANETFNATNEFPEKKPKFDENIKKTVTRNESSEEIKTEVKVQPSNNEVNEDSEDEETKLYRLKIEEQKRERERILRIKEERRRQMMQERQKQNEVKLCISQDEGKNQRTSKQQQPPSISSQPLKTNNFGHSAETVSVQNCNKIPPRSLQNRLPQKQNTSYVLSTSSVQQQQKQQPRQYSINNPHSDTEVSDLTFKVSNNLQSNVPVTKDIPKAEASSSSFMSNRVVVVKNKQNQKSGVLANPKVTSSVNNETSKEFSDVGQGLSSFFNNRKVLKKDNELLNTRLVVVNNLSTTINQSKLTALTHGIGEIQ